MTQKALLGQSRQGPSIEARVQFDCEERFVPWTWLRPLNVIERLADLT